MKEIEQYKSSCFIVCIFLSRLLKQPRQLAKELRK